ncbi:hypothetical protein M5D96_006518 [Drosophila gunungcola]|uniref:Uncharacterized protein n=1 Tax=Drosophila gunungcola TaxID=103775 RepID=A0A9P9YPM2_9MUSC|nr:hypothetical protein M5D96_006518 [Drosophila gunungcola]
MEGGSSQLIITIPANRLWPLVIVISPGERKWRGDTTNTRKSPTACSSGKFPAYRLEPCHSYSTQGFLFC